IAALARKGVKVKILTGDNDVITRKICRDVGLQPGEILLGGSVEKMSDDNLADLAHHTTVFAKLMPGQKERIVHALHSKGHVVGFLGDGINDSPALKAADVGISVDSAVDIAKESADIILLEKSLMVLQDGLIEGRKIFANITKYIKMGASSNFGNMFSVLGASLFLPFLPMAPIQVRTNNLLYDFSQTAIPTDNVDEDYIAAPRRWDIDNIFKFMVFIGPISSIFRLCDLRNDALDLRRLGQREPVSDRLVRRVASDPNIDHPYYSHRQDTLYREPRQSGTYDHHRHHLLYWRRPSLYVGRKRAGVHSSPPTLLAAGYGSARRLRYLDPFCEGVVRAPLGNVRRNPQRTPMRANSGKFGGRP